MSKFKDVTVFSELLGSGVTFRLNIRSGYGDGAYNMIATKKLVEYEKSFTPIEVELYKLKFEKNRLNEYRDLLFLASDISTGGEMGREFEELKKDATEMLNNDYKKIDEKIKKLKS